MVSTYVELEKENDSNITIFWGEKKKIKGKNQMQNTNIQILYKYNTNNTNYIG